MKLGELIAIINLIAFVSPTLINLSLVSISINEAKVAFQRMFDFSNMLIENQNGSLLIHNINTIYIKNLSFGYPGRSKLLKNISLSMDKGEIVFLIGESGSGKTTLSKLIEKSYNYEEGNIYINGNVDIKNVSLNIWRDNLGTIPQDIYI